MSLIVDEHRQYVSDRLRVETLTRAVDAIIRPGDVVVDLGTGTGILGFLACRAGARHVYAIEASGMIEIARELALANGFSDRMTFIHQHSFEVRLPEAADVLLADLVGGMGFEAGLFQTYGDARRFLKPDARVMPANVTLAATPVEDPSLFDEVQFWSHGFAGIDSGPVLRWATNTGYPRLLDSASVLSQDDIKVSVDPLAGLPMIRLHGCVRIQRAGLMHGIGGWFEADLAPGVPMTNSPRATTRLNRRNVFFPLDRAVPVAPGDVAGITIRIRPSDKLVTWDVNLEAASGRVRERHSTLNGMLLTREDLQAHAPDVAPRLTPRGLARRSVLELCDGQRALRAIEDEVFRRHPALFKSRGEAQAFVAEVVARYGEPRP